MCTGAVWNCAFLSAAAREHRCPRSNGHGARNHTRGLNASGSGRIGATAECRAGP
jgi:hypothetical protein